MKLGMCMWLCGLPTQCPGEVRSLDTPLVISHPIPVISHPIPVISHPIPVISHPIPVTSHPIPVTRHYPEVEAAKMLLKCIIQNPDILG